MTMGRNSSISARLRHRDFSKDYDQMSWKTVLETFRPARYWLYWLKCFVSYSFGILEFERGKDKTPWTDGSFQNCTQRIKYTVQRPHQAHSAPQRALSQRQLPSAVKKQHKRHL